MVSMVRPANIALVAVMYSIRHNDREQKLGVYSYTLATQMLDITKTVIVVPFYHETDRALHSLDCEQAVIF